MAASAAAEVRRHIAFKTANRELDSAVADRMLAALDAGAEPDYATLHQRALFPPPPSVCFHTAPVAARDAITREGLRPGTGQNWGGLADGQPEAVYVGPVPDTRGIWSHWEVWDVWAVDMTGLEWHADRLNPGCWALGPVPPDRLVRQGPYSYADRTSTSGSESDRA